MDEEWERQTPLSQNLLLSASNSILFILCNTNGDSSSAISAPSQWSNRIILRFNHTAFWAARQLILMYCILGFNPVQNHSGWSLKCQIRLIPGIKYTSVTRRRFVLMYFSWAAEHRAASWGRRGVTASHYTNPSSCLMGAQRMYLILCFLLKFADVADPSLGLRNRSCFFFWGGGSFLQVLKQWAWVYTDWVDPKL